MNLQPYESILAQPLAFWAACTDQQNVVDVVRCIGLAPLNDYDTITFFIPEKYSENFIQNLYTNKPLTFLGCALVNYESYQYKGTFKSLRSCTEDEVEIQRLYMETFSDLTELIGLAKEPVYKAYFHLPSVAVSMKVDEIFEQTPRQGTGKLLEKKT